MTNTEEQTVSPAVDAYRRAQDEFDGMLIMVHEWDADSACAGWSVGDVLGHVLWGLEMVRHLAIGEEYESRVGAPGAERPRDMIGRDALESWRMMRDAARDAVGDNAAHLPAPPRFVERNPDATLEDFLRLMVLDILAHTWDIAHPLGIPVELPEDLLEFCEPVVQAGLLRREGFFGPEVTPEPGADATTKWLALLGRAA